jgi:hypothetical protein
MEALHGAGIGIHLSIGVRFNIAYITLKLNALKRVSRLCRRERKQANRESPKGGQDPPS